MYPVGKISDRKSTCSSDNEDGTLMGPTSANGMRAYSAWPPAYPPSMCEYPNRPAGERPHSFSAIQALGFEFSHSENCSPWQKKQLPQAIGNGFTIRSPTLRLRTPDPTSTTS